MFRELTRLLMILLPATFLLVALPDPVSAGTQDDAVIVLHAAPHAMKGDPCFGEHSPVETELPCRNFTTTWPLETASDLYLMVARGEPGAGVAALSCGVLYNRGETGETTKSDIDGVDVFSWTYCASGLEFPTVWPDDPDGFPASGGGMRLTWDATVDCQTREIGDDGVHTLAGVFYVFAYSEDLLEIIPNSFLSTGPELQVGDCDDNLTDLTYPDAAGAVAFGEGTGRNPCIPDPVKSISWSRLKTTYQNNGEEP